jgi:para-aminobenzoate synthetase / 4-amino-4-deoxychorismate lyase
MNTNSKEQIQPLLSFEFANLKGEITPFTFQNPQQVIIAQTLDEILPSLQLVQDAVDSGFYAAGFLSYESAPAFDSSYRVREGSRMPLLWFGIFSEPAIQPLTSTGDFTVTEWTPSVSRNEYNQSIFAIKQLIESGDTYQTNYTIRLTSDFKGDDVAFFDRLKKAQSSNYCAYINTGDHSILSASPELFFHLEDGQITTRPMKGTTKRGKVFAEDRENANELYHSEKNRAENVMIVDLLRNDLGMIAKPSTVTVEKLFEIEQYPTVHQMTSTITAKVAEQTQLVDIFKALFPCGSITGAPKISTMNIIADLETRPREVYCGAIGYITPNNEAIFNVPIRSVLIEHSTCKADYGVGGGITWDSTTEGEYLEILAKAKLLEEEPVTFQLLESLLLDNGNYFLLDEHLRRLDYSAQYFGFKIKNVKGFLNEYSLKNSDGLFKVRLLAAKNGELTIESQPISLEETALNVVIADNPIDENNLYLYHKTTNRKVYSEFQKQKPSNIFDVLLWNNDGEVTEFTNGNVVVEMEGCLWTPPVSSGLLAGTFRESLIKKGEIFEKVISLSDLEQCTRIWFINSIRKWKEVQVMQKVNR